MKLYTLVASSQVSRMLVRGSSTAARIIMAMADPEARRVQQPVQVGGERLLFFLHLLLLSSLLPITHADYTTTYAMEKTTLLFRLALEKETP